MDVKASALLKRLGKNGNACHELLGSVYQEQLDMDMNKRVEKTMPKNR